MHELHLQEAEGEIVSTALTKIIQKCELDSKTGGGAENDRLRKQNDKLIEQRNIYHTICDENDLVNYHRHIKALDAEIEEIK